MKFLLGLCALFFLGACGSSSSDVYRIGIDPNWYPLDLPGRMTNLTAFSNELLQEIARIEKIELAKVDTNWNTLVWGLRGDKNTRPLYEAILSSMQPYIFHQKEYDFSTSFLATGPVLVMPVSSPVNALDQLEGKEIAILRGSEGALILEKYPGILIRTYDSLAQAFIDISKGTVDGLLCDALTATAYCQDLYSGQLHVATPPLNDAGLRLIVLHQKYPHLLAAFNSGLQKLHTSGKYDELIRKWRLSPQ
jgi:polar amino acid transport system substrate-binding protein